MTSIPVEVEKVTKFLEASLSGLYLSESKVACITFLTDIHNWLVTESDDNFNRKQYFQTHPYPQFIGFLLNKVALVYLPRFTETEAQSHFYFYFSSYFSSSELFRHLVLHLKSTTHFTILQLLGQILTTFIQDNRIVSIFDSIQLFSTTNNRNNIKQLNSASETILNDLCGLPDIMANKLQRNTLQIFMANNYFQLILQQLDALLVQNEISDSILTGIIYIYSKLTRLGYSPLISQRILANSASILSDNSKTNIYSRILLSIQVSALEILVQQFLIELTQYNILTTEQKIQLLKTLFSNILLNKSNESENTGIKNNNNTTSVSAPNSGAILLKSLLTSKFLLTKPINLSVSTLIMNLLFNLSYTDPTTIEPSNDLFDSALNLLGKQWNNENFIQFTEHNIQYIISETLCYGLSLLDKQQKTVFQAQNIDLIELAKRSDEDPFFGPFSNHNIILLIMNGVQLRLSSPINSIRTSAMKLAKAFSILIDPTKPLDFDIVQEGLNTDLEEEENKVKDINNNTSKKKIITKFDAVQEDLKVNNNSSNNNTIPIQSLSFPNEQHDDESDLRTVPLPLYLRETLEYFKKLDTRDHIEAALENLEKLIRLKPNDLNYIAQELATSLLQIGTTVFMEDANLNLIRLKSLVALIVCSPMNCVNYLIMQFYSKNQTIRGKLDILDSLVSAAAELSNIKHSENNQKQQTTLLIQELEQNKQKNNNTSTKLLTSSSDSKTTNSTAINHAEIIRNRVEKTTRRWGNAANQINDNIITGVNHFANVVQLFFFPLITGFHLDSNYNNSNNDKKDNEKIDILHSEPMLLSRTLDSLGMFIIYTGPALINRTLCKNLLEILLITRYNTESAVRRATVFNMSRILLNVSKITFQSDYDIVLNELIEWLNHTSDRDSDEETRNFARFCLYLIQQLMGNAFEQLLQHAQKQANSAVAPVLRIL